MRHFAFWNRLGIGGRLFLAFAAIMGSLPGLGVGRLAGVARRGRNASTITRTAMPAATEARAVAEASARLIASAPPADRRHKRGAPRGRGGGPVRRGGPVARDPGRLDPLRVRSRALSNLGASVDRLLQNLSAQNDLVARRLALAGQNDALIADGLAAAIGLFDLSETLVSNATAGTSAVISNLYGLVEDPAQLEQTLLALDRLVESDVFFMERMFELRAAAPRPRRPPPARTRRAARRSR